MNNISEDHDLLSEALVKRCNPGLTDFGTGNVIAKSSQCLRSAKQPTECSICIDACPAGALQANSLQRPVVAKSCLKCGYCISICPVNAITATTKTLQQVVRILLQATLRVDKLAITCARSMGLLRLDSLSSDPEEANKALGFLQKAEASDNLYVIPCLAMLSTELWFTVLNEIGVARIREVSVYLPIGQCDLCPVNCKDEVEQTFSHAIDTAESWSGHNVSIIDTAENVPQSQSNIMRGYLSDTVNTDRRGVFTGVYDQLKRTLEDTGRTGNRAADEALWIRARRETINSTVLADEITSVISATDKPILTNLRQALVEAIGRNPDNANRVVLMVSTTDESRCDGCSECVSVCPLKARKIESEKANADPLYCMGCSACIQVCPQKACSFSLVSGLSYLRV